MAINFVPDDYIKNVESQRTNLIYVILLCIVMVGFGGVFMAIKVRQHSLEMREELINARMEKVKESISQFEQLRSKRQKMLKTALMTSELLEPVPRSILLALFTNNLPHGTSLLKLKMIQEKPKFSKGKDSVTTKYDQNKSAKSKAAKPKLSPERLLETHIELEGIAPSDLQVASYIEQLSSSNLLINVALVESKEHKIDNSVYRQFKLTAVLKNAVHLSKSDINIIRSDYDGAGGNF